MANNQVKCLMVDQYRKVREMKRACIVSTLNTVLNKEEDAVVVKWNKIIDPIRELLDEQQTLYNAANDEYNRKTKPINVEIQRLNGFIYQEEAKKNKELNVIRKKTKKPNIHDPCIEKRPKELAKFDRETEEKILEFLNGTIDKLEV